MQADREGKRANIKAGIERKEQKKEIGI